jgi:hypothetical protein
VAFFLVDAIARRTSEIREINEGLDKPVDGSGDGPEKPFESGGLADTDKAVHSIGIKSLSEMHLYPYVWAASQERHTMLI